MQHFQLDSRGDVDEPLFNWSSSSGWEPMRKGGWSSDESVRTGLLGRFDEWWYSLSPEKRQSVKRWSCGGVLVMVVVLIIVSVSLATNTTTQDQSSASSAASTVPTTDAVPKVLPSPAASPPNTPTYSPPAWPSSPTASPPAVPTPPPQSPPPTSPAVSSPPPPPSPGADTVLQDHFCTWADLYLPDDVTAVRYDLALNVTLQPEYDPTATPDSNRVQGRVSIRVRVPHSTNCLVLHADGNTMQVSRAVWRPPGGVSPDVPGTDLTFNNKTQQLIIRFASPIPASDSVTSGQPVPRMTHDGAADEAALGQLIIDFSYNMVYGLDGFYLSRYSDPEDPSSQHLMASTQFEAIAARKALPCFDEPRMKARFALTLRTAATFTVLSNMPLTHLSDVAPDGTSERQFQVSPPMVTYLMAWVVGVLDSRSNPNCQTNTGAPGSANMTVPISVWATPANANLLGHALDAGCAAVQRYVSTLGVPYALPKLDIVGIPEFAAGAMENWGIITFQESYLLSDPDEDDVQQAMDVGTVVAHEISHQWFGNLVTCADWGELWLNEGFATYLEDLGADAWKPSYGFLESFFFTGATVPGLVGDSVNSTHALSTLGRVKDLPEIDNYFDEISYQKGGAVLRMLRMYLSVAVAGGGAFTNAGAVPRTSAPATGTATPTAFSSLNITGLPLRKLRSHDARRKHTRRLVRGGVLSASMVQTSRSLLQTGSLEGTQYLRPTWRDEPLFAGLKQYLEANAYGVATAEVLWDTLSNATGLPIKQWMRSWTYDRNYPVLHVTGTSDSTQPDPTNPAQSVYAVAVNVRQSPILSDRACGVAAPGALMDAVNQTMVGQWWLPVPAAVQVAGGPNPVQVTTLDACTATLSLSFPSSPPGPLLLNVGRFGFYRVNYTSEGWTALGRLAGDASVVSAVDMAGLLSDSYRLTEKDQLSLSPFLLLAAQLGQRATAEYPPWSVALSKLRHMRLLLSIRAHETEDESVINCVRDFDKYMWENITRPFIESQQLSFYVSKGDTVQRRLLRPMVLTAAGSVGAKNVTEAASTLMKDVVDSKGAVSNAGLHADVRTAVYCLSQRYDTNTPRRSKNYEDLKQLYLAESSVIEKGRLLNALTCVTGPSLYKDLLDFITTSGVRIQDVGNTLLRLGTQSGEAFAAVWEFLTSDARFLKLLARWPTRQSATYSLGLAIKQLASYFTDDYWDEDIQTFFNTYSQMLDPNFYAWYEDHKNSNKRWLDSLSKDLCHT